MNGLGTIIVRLPKTDRMTSAESFEDIKLTLNKTQSYEDEKLNSKSLIGNEEIHKTK